MKLLILAALWAGTALFALGFGAVPLPAQDILAMLAQRLLPAGTLEGALAFLAPGAGGQPPWPAAHEVILFQIRLPRVLLAGLVGASLSLSGAALQGLFRNPMASPSVLGVSSGAALGAACAIVWAPAAALWGLGAAPVAAFAGAVATTLLVYRFAGWGAGPSTPRLLLAGVALGAFFSALVSLVIVFGEQRTTAVVFWLMGSLANADWAGILLILPYFLLGAAVAVLYSRDLNALLLGEEGAQHLGVDVKRVQNRLLLATSLLTGAAVSVSGVIGFVGLIVPHAVRALVGPDHRLLVPASALVGAIFLTLADTLGRTIAAPTEVPVGAITALLGGPFFLSLLWRREG